MLPCPAVKKDGDVVIGDGGDNAEIGVGEGGEKIDVAVKEADAANAKVVPNMPACTMDACLNFSCRAAMKDLCMYVYGTISSSPSSARRRRHCHGSLQTPTKAAFSW
ncbi:hypothetical protein L7F22_022292 [Adiantum nelumboides]|nr:hypothetical protein [Adiantum nelumboides]